MSASAPTDVLKFFNSYLFQTVERLFIQFAFQSVNEHRTEKYKYHVNMDPVLLEEASICLNGIPTTEADEFSAIVDNSGSALANTWSKGLSSAPFGFAGEDKFAGGYFASDEGESSTT